MNKCKAITRGIRYGWIYAVPCLYSFLDRHVLQDANTFLNPQRKLTSVRFFLKPFPTPHPELNYLFTFTKYFITYETQI